MSSDRFDELTKGLANGATSRRKFLTGLAGAAAGAVFGARQARGVVPPGGSTCSNEGQSCTAQQCCQGLNCLTDFTSSTEKFCCAPGTPLVCGSKCCPTGAVLGCSAGKCTCPTGEVVCPDANNPLAGKCVNLAEDVNNCGACGVTCADPTGADAPCRVAACVNKGCTTVAKPGSNGTPCEDGNLCTLNDTCNNGTCQAGTQKQCPQCQKCDPSTGGCVPDPNQVGNPCDDGLACTTDDRCTAAGTCAGTPILCQPLDQCHVAGVCEEPGGKCTNPIKLNGTPCETGNLCTADTCQNGTCAQGPVDVTCPDEQCQKCNPSTGMCQPVANGTACNDGNACTVNDTCQAGFCTAGAPRVCDDNNECTQDTCDPATGCVHTPLTGTPCETGNKCTADTCDNGVCKQGPPSVTCPQCQVCDPDRGTCVNLANGTACEDGDVCTLGDTCQNGTCVSGPVKTCGQCQVCANVGGVATCVADTSKNGQTCNDGNACTTGETCQNGVCTGGTPKNCNDGNECTQDSCDQTTGTCLHTPLTGTPCGMPGSGRTCCNGTCCMSGNICCATKPEKCGRPTGAGCTNRNQCCSDVCVLGRCG
jgi:hypothetical protein